MFDEILGSVYFQNPLRDYLVSLGLFVLGVLLLRIFRRMILGRMKAWSEKTDNVVDDSLVVLIEKSLLPLLYFFAFFGAVSYLRLPEKAGFLFHRVFAVLITLLGIRAVTSFVRSSMKIYWDRREEAGNGAGSFRGISSLINLLIWTIGLVFLLDNLGFKISAVVTGLGIGGVAIALASQAILGDLFSYFIIFFDRPFRQGDFILVDDKMGVVEKIGIKSTRVRSLGGELLIFSNKDLTNSRIHNFRKMEQRRVLFQLGVVYETSLEDLKTLPGLIRGVLEENEGVSVDRVSFKAFGDFSLLFEVVYFMKGPDYNRYMDLQQRINLRLFEEFGKRGIAFAYPTQTLYHNRMPS